MSTLLVLLSPYLQSMFDVGLCWTWKDWLLSFMLLFQCTVLINYRYLGILFETMLLTTSNNSIWFINAFVKVFLCDKYLSHLSFHICDFSCHLQYNKTPNCCGLETVWRQLSCENAIQLVCRRSVVLPRCLIVI